MGLTIHYSLTAQGGETQAREFIHALHQTAQDLPFKELGQVVELSGWQCDCHNRPKDDPLRWLLIQAAESVEVTGGRKGYTNWYNVTPLKLIAFDAWPGEGCEASNFGLCQYPPVIQTDRGPLKTGFSGWRWRSFCKTQYASNPKCGGAPNFLRCHLTVIAMLDRAKALGCLEHISDEGGFWEQRDLPALVREVGSWNEMIAALGGKMKDILGHGPLQVESEIARFPTFEQLEAAGEGKLPPELKKLFALLERVTAVPGARAEAGREVLHHPPNRMETHITIAPDGTVRCLWTEAVPLQELGRLELQRAYAVEFDHEAQAWRVLDRAAIVFINRLRGNRAWPGNESA